MTYQLLTSNDLWSKFNSAWKRVTRTGHTFPKEYFFPVVMYLCISWTNVWHTEIKEKYTKKFLSKMRSQISTLITSNAIGDCKFLIYVRRKCTKGANEFTCVDVKTNIRNNALCHDFKITVSKVWARKLEWLANKNKKQRGQYFCSRANLTKFRSQGKTVSWKFLVSTFRSKL